MSFRWGDVDLSLGAETWLKCSSGGGVCVERRGERFVYTGISAASAIWWVNPSYLKACLHFSTRS